MRIHICLLCLLLSLAASGLEAQTLPPNMYADTAHAPFLWGVGSFDPTADRVLLWTKVDAQVAMADSTVYLEVFEDEALTVSVFSSPMMVHAAGDWTAKVDAVLPSPDHFYWYRWRDGNGDYSVVGRTKTASVGPDSQIRLGVMSCSSIFSGYFNAYARIAERDDIDLVVHVGDYIYDFVDQDEQVRVPVPAPVDPQTLAEWRDRHSYYLLDPDLRAARQNHPWAVIWDNHDTDGDTPQHTMDSEQAFQEYVPMRVNNAAFPHLIYRRLAYGDLLDILFVDATTLRDVDTLANGDWSIMGDAQWAWLSQELSNSTARWRMIAQERMMAEFSTAGLGSLINYGDGPVADSGAWDGYAADRLRLLDYLDQNGIDNNLVLSGDIHMSFLCDLPLDYGSYNAQTGAGSAAVEFLPTSISRGNFDEQGVSGFLAQLVQGAITLANPHHVYSELTSHGYGIVDIRPDTLTAEFWYSPILQQSSTESFAAGYECITGENHWRRTETSGPTTAADDLGKPMASSPFALVVFPNPAGDRVTLRLESSKAGDVALSLVDVGTGRVVIAGEKLRLRAGKVEEVHWLLGDLPAGEYQVWVADGKGIVTGTVVHIR